MSLQKDLERLVLKEYEGIRLEEAMVKHEAGLMFWPEGVNGPSVTVQGYWVPKFVVKHISEVLRQNEKDIARLTCLLETDDG